MLVGDAGVDVGGVFAAPATLVPPALLGISIASAPSFSSEPQPEPNPPQTNANTHALQVRGLNSNAGAKRFAAKKPMSMTVSVGLLAGAGKRDKFVLPRCAELPPAAAPPQRPVPAQALRPGHKPALQLPTKEPFSSE